MINSKFIQIQGREYVLDNQPFIPKGINLGNWLHIEHYMHGLPSVENDMHKQMEAILGKEKKERYWKIYRDSYIQEKDIKLIAENGFNCIRLPLNVSLFEESENFGETAFSYLDKLFGWATKYQIYVQFDLHALPGGQARDHNADPCYGIIPAFWNHQSFRKRALKVLSALAERYAGEKYLWGYSPACEPNTDNIALLNQYYQDSISCIREYDKQHIILLEPNHWARDIDSLESPLFDDPQVTYQIHIYFFFHCDISTMNDYPSTNPDNPFDISHLQAMVDKCLDRDRIQRPVTLAEFGVLWENSMFHQIDEDHKQILIMAKASRDMRRIMEKSGGGWCLWAYKDLGIIGALQTKKESPWKRFLAKKEIANLYHWLEENYKPDFSDNDSKLSRFQQEISSRFVFDDKDTLAAATLAVKRSIETLLLRHILMEMDKLPEKEFDDCAASFDLDFYQFRNEVQDLLLAD